MTQIMTQTGLRLEMVSLEMRGLVDRSVKSPRLHEIIEYCVQRRLLHSFQVWAVRGNDGLMRLDVEIDYEEHDRQIRLAGDGLPDGVAGCYPVARAPGNDGGWRAGCPHVGKAVDLFVKTARDRGLHLTWNVCFCDKHAELNNRFGLTCGTSSFRDLTRNAKPNRIVHSLYSELSVSARISPDSGAPPGPGREYEKRQS